MGLREIRAYLPRALGTACCCLALGAAGAAAADAPPLPAWRSLLFEQSRFGVTARSQVAVDAGPAGGESWQLHATSSIANNTETVCLALDPASAAVLERTRMSSGRNRRYKSYNYLPEYILRLRREPADDAGVPPRDWPVSSRREIPYPTDRDGLVVTEAYVLLLLAGRLQPGAEQPAAVIVYTDEDFYRVIMRVEEGPELDVDYSLAGSGERVTGPRPTRRVTLTVSPMQGSRGGDFSLLGLEGEISLYLDADSGLPLELRGDAPRIGSSTIDLREVALRASLP